MAHDLHTIEEKWPDKYSSYYIPSGQSYRELLLERLGEELLNAFNAHIWVKNCVLQSWHVRVSLKAFGRNFDLINIGYTERPKWQLSGHTRSGKWLVLKLKDEELRPHLEGLLELLQIHSTVQFWNE